MRQTLLQIVQAFAARTGIPRPQAAVGLNQAEVRQMVALLEEVGEELVSRFNWQDLKKKATWAALPAVEQGNVFQLAGEDLERIIPGTFFNETERTYFSGPVPAEDWPAYTANVNTTPAAVFAVFGDVLRVWPPPSAGDMLSFYWQSAQWILSPSGQYRSTFQSDEDKPVFDATLMRLGLRYRWKMEKGLPYAEDFRAFEAAALDKASRGKLQPPLHMAGSGKAVRPTIGVPLNATIPVP